MIPQTDSNSMEARLGRLERQNRRLRLGGAAGLLLCAGGVLMGQAGPSGRSVEAREIVLRDDGGTVRARLAVKESGPELAFYDTQERSLVRLLGTDGTQGLYVQDSRDRNRVALSMVEGKPRLSLSNAEGKPQTELVVNEDGPSLVLYDAGQNGRVWLNASESTGGLAIYDARALRASLSVTELGPVLLLSDPDRMPLAMLGAARKFPNAPSEPSLILYDKAGRSRAVVGSALGSIRTGGEAPPSPPSFALYDENGKRIWAAP